MDKMLKQYLDRAKEIIGERTAGEIAYDNAVVDALNSGLPIMPLYLWQVNITRMKRFSVTPAISAILLPTTIT